MSLSDLLCEVVQLSCHFIAFRTFLFRRLLLFLVPVIPDSWKGERRQVRGHLWLCLHCLSWEVPSPDAALDSLDTQNGKKALQTSLPRREAWQPGEQGRE